MVRAPARPSSPRRTQGAAVGVSVLAGLATFALYLRLAPHVSGSGDSSEFTLVLALDGIAHQTGYPLYTLCGHPFVRALHALGAPWSFAANAWSALLGALAIALMQALGGRVLPLDEVRNTGPESAVTRQYFAEVTRRINAGTPLPVVEFDPLVPVVRVLPKP